MYSDVEKDSRLAELVGIILGDGSLKLNYSKSQYYCEIALNYVDERKYVEYVVNLISSIFKIKPFLRISKRDKSVIVRVFRKNIIEYLVSIGLIPSNKIKNHARVPDWIKRENSWIEENKNEWYAKYKSLVIACIKGLFDTDGTIYLIKNLKKNYFSIGIGFSSGSEYLIRDFKDMCKSIGIQMTKISIYNGITKYGTKYTGYSVNTEAKNQVYKFIYEVIKPFKWLIKKDLIERELLDYGLKIDSLFKYKRKKA